jgi:polysaccharide pyruvyl transferase WcaK-like protein
LGLNVTPFPKQYVNGFLKGCSGSLPSGDLAKPDAPHREIGAKTLVGYSEALTRVVQHYRRLNWRIECVPFAIDDEVFAKVLFAGMGVKVWPFSLNIWDVMYRMRRFDRFIATRYHSHVFGLLTRVPTFSVAYGPNCEELWKDLNCSSDFQVTPVLLAEDSQVASQRLRSGDGAILTNMQVEQMCEQAADSFRKAGAALGVF